MTNVERFQAARTHVAQVYADTAAKLAETVKNDPTVHMYGEYLACQAAWGALVDVENALRASVMTGDVIDDYYREGAVRADGARKG